MRGPRREGFGGSCLALVVFMLMSGCSWDSPSGPSDSDEATVYTLPPQNPPQASGSDRPGAVLIATGGLGDGSIKVVLARNATWSVEAGHYFEPKDGAYQRMMVWKSVSFVGPGAFTIGANCMQLYMHTPASSAPFFSQPKPPTTAVHQCQKRCGNDQACIWSCGNG